MWSWTGENPDAIRFKTVQLYQMLLQRIGYTLLPEEFSSEESEESELVESATTRTGAGFRFLIPPAWGSLFTPPFTPPLIPPLSPPGGRYPAAFTFILAGR
jgi:hypothetical protein